MLKSATENMQVIMEIAEKTKNIELKKEILDLKQHVLDLQTENIELRKTLQETQKKQEYNMVFENNIYVNRNEDGTVEGKYCTPCWDSKNKAVRLNKLDSYSYEYRCLVCENYFVTNNAYQEPSLSIDENFI